MEPEIEQAWMNLINDCANQLETSIDAFKTVYPDASTVVVMLDGQPVASLKMVMRGVYAVKNYLLDK